MEAASGRFGASSRPTIRLFANKRGNGRVRRSGGGSAAGVALPQGQVSRVGVQRRGEGRLRRVPPNGMRRGAALGGGALATLPLAWDVILYKHKYFVG